MIQLGPHVCRLEGTLCFSIKGFPWNIFTKVLLLPPRWLMNLLMVMRKLVFVSPLLGARNLHSVFTGITLLTSHNFPIKFIELQLFFRGNCAVTPCRNLFNTTMEVQTAFWHWFLTDVFLHRDQTRTLWSGASYVCPPSSLSRFPLWRLLWRDQLYTRHRINRRRLFINFRKVCDENMIPSCYIQKKNLCKYTNVRC